MQRVVPLSLTTQRQYSRAPLGLRLWDVNLNISLRGGGHRDVVMIHGASRVTDELVKDYDI